MKTDEDRWVDYMNWTHAVALWECMTQGHVWILLGPTRSCKRCAYRDYELDPSGFPIKVRKVKYGSVHRQVG